MIVSVQYTQLNSTSCLRETFHDGVSVALETLEQIETPVEVQRLMLMPIRSINPDPTMGTLTPNERLVLEGLFRELRETTDKIARKDVIRKLADYVNTARPEVKTMVTQMAMQRIRELGG